MFYIYNDTERGGSFDPKMMAIIMKMNPNTQYAKHFDNLCYLRFIANHPDTTFVEKAQANKEIGLAEKKMNFWKRQDSWTPEESGRLMSEIKKRWHTA